MNDLQLAIVAIGAALIVGIWGHWKWQELRHRKVAQRLLDPTHGDALLAGPFTELPAEARPSVKPAKAKETAVAERREPVIDLNVAATDDSEEANSDDGGFVPERVESGSVTASSGAARAPQASRPIVAESGIGGYEPGTARKPVSEAASTVRPSVGRPLSVVGEPSIALLSPEVDFIAAFELAEAASGDALLAVARNAGQNVKKRIAWVAADESAGAPRWEMLRSDGQYRHLRVGIQLADRGGPLSAGMLEQFRRTMERVGDELTALAEMPASREALTQAIKLDRICAEVDIQLSVNIVPRHPPFSLDAVRDAALAVGFSIGSDGLLAYSDASGQRLFVLQSAGGPNKPLSFVFDLPAVSNGEIAFDRMMRVAKEFADAIDGLLVDDQKRPVTDRFIAPVRGQIRELQARMAVQGIPAGSEIALRLFA
jgi:hypothetical protein